MSQELKISENDSRPRRRHRGGERVVKVSGNNTVLIQTVATASAQYAVPLQPVSGTFFGQRLFEIADQYRLFRFTRLRAILCGRSDNDFGGVAFTSIVAYTNGTVGTPPSTFAEVAEIVPSATHLPGMTKPTVLDLGRRDLLDDAVPKWFLTEADALDPVLDTQGQVYFTAAEAGTIASVVGLIVRFEWDVELCEPLPAAVSLERLKRALALESDKDWEMGSQAGEKPKDPPSGYPPRLSRFVRR
jgi:hypothetical protein